MRAGAPRVPAALFALLALAACAGPRAPAGASWFRGDRVTVDRDFIRLDDPAFLHSAETYGLRSEDAFSFRLSFYFNARAGDTLRFGPGAATLRPARGRDGAPAAPMACAVDSGDDAPDSAGIAARLADTARPFRTAVRPGRETFLAVHCAGYRPPRGRVDTLDLVCEGSPGHGAARMLLPFHVSYHGPAVSILLGATLLFVFTEAGLWASRSR